MKVIRRSRKQVIKNWVEALRSGEYEQTTKVLKNHKGFCCLGVLCDLAAKDGGVQWNGYLYKDKEYTPPSNIQEFIFGESDSDFMDDLVHYNDSGKSFKFIANKIEKKLLK